MGAPLFISHPACLAHDTGAGHPERPERLRAIEAELAAHDHVGYECRPAPEAPPEAIAAVHGAAYIERVRATAERGGTLDAGETVAGPGSWAAALRSAGGACELARALVAGEASTGFCATRPPGHHAAPNVTSGFCLFNNVAVAAQHAIDTLGVRRVLILDWDVHHGNGTADIFRTRDDVLYASIHQRDMFPGTGPLTDVGAQAGEGFTINVPVPAGSDGSTWRSLVEWIVVPAAQEFAPDLILISAGYDAHRDDPLGGCALDDDDFGAMAATVRDLGAQVGAPVGAVLEGGYDPPALARSVRATMAALAGDDPAPSVAPDFITERAASHIGHYWTL